MRKAWLWLAAWAMVLAAAPWAAGAEQAAERPGNVILIGWDGCQREHMQQCLARGELPALKQLAAEGRLVTIDIRGTTDTKAGWSQILTGYDPPITGVYSNGRYQPVPEGYSLFERLKARFGADDFAAVAVIGKKAHCGEFDPPKKIALKEGEEVLWPAQQKKIDAEKAAAKAAAKSGDGAAGKAADKPARKAGQKAAGKQAKGAADKAKTIKAGPGSKIVVEGGVRYLVTPGKPYMNMHKACDEWIIGLQLDEKVGAKALELLDKHKDKPFFFFVHFAEIDHKGHKFGENSKEYNDAVISADTWTGKIVQKLKGLGLYTKTRLYVTADHGFDEDMKKHKKAPYVFLGTNDPKVTRDGDRADVATTIYDRFGLDPGKFQPPLSGHSLLGPALAVVEAPKAQAAAPK
jgi:hypothetical protein